jgi:hypothetical protein
MASRRANKPKKRRQLFSITEKEEKYDKSTMMTAEIVETQT